MPLWLTAVLASLAVVPLAFAAVMAVLNARSDMDVERVVYEDIVALEQLIKEANGGDEHAQANARNRLNQIISDYEIASISRLDTQRDGSLVIHESRVQPQA